MERLCDKICFLCKRVNSGVCIKRERLKGEAGPVGMRNEPSDDQQRKIAMSDIDQVSKSLGRLEADMEASQRQRAELFKQNGEIKDILGEIKTVVQVVKTHSADIEKLQSDNKKFHAIKNKALGWVSAIGLSAGGVGTYISSMFSGKHP